MKYVLKKFNKTMLHKLAVDMNVPMGKRADCKFEKVYRQNAWKLTSDTYEVLLTTCDNVACLHVHNLDEVEDVILKPDLDYLIYSAFVDVISCDDPEPEPEAEPETELEPEPVELNVDVYDAYKGVTFLGGVQDFLPFPNWESNQDTLLNYLLNRASPGISPAAYLRCYDELQDYVRDYTGSLVEFFWDPQIPEYHARLDHMADGWEPINENCMTYEIKLLRFWEYLHDPALQCSPFDPDGRAIIL